jgi:hypothetical protein
MTQRLILLARIREAVALNAALEAAEGWNWGPNNLDRRYLGNRELKPNPQTGEYDEKHTHLGCTWFVMTQAEYDAIEELVAIHAPHAVRRIDPVQDNATELVKEVIRDHVLIAHKQFPNGKWGWSAKIVTEDPTFDPRVRSVWIYADEKHRQYKYTTGAFTLQNGEWVTEWNEQRDRKADVHWVVSWATTPEVEGSLLVEEEADVAYIRFGKPINPTKPPAEPVVQPWKQPAGAHDAYAMNSQVTHNGQTWRSTINANVWAPGVFGWVVA